MQTLDAVPTFLDPKGGTPYVMYRKDRVRLVQGAEQLKEFRLSVNAKTRRIVACCCNTPVFLEFHGGHWLSLYSCLWPDNARPISKMRTMTMDRKDPSVLPNDIPNSKRQSPSFMVKLLGAWIAMGFRAPKITYVDDTLEIPEVEIADETT